MKSNLVPEQKDRLAQLAPWASSTSCCSPAGEITLSQPDTAILLTRTYNLVLHSLTLPPPPHYVRQDTFSSIYTLLTELLQQNLRVRDRKTLLFLSLLSFQSVYVLSGVLRICLLLESSGVWHAYTLIIFPKYLHSW